MARQSRDEYLRAMWQRDQQATRRERSMILDEVTRVCGYHRKHGIRLLSARTPPWPPVRRVGRRRPTYGEPVIRLPAEIWQAAGYLCGPRLKAAIPHWLPWLKRRTPVTPAVEAQLRRISARQIDRRLREQKRRIKRRLYGTTRPGSLLKHQIPIKTEHWDVRTPGYLEIDLVSHSGVSAAGEFLHPLDCVDIQTTWVERQAVMGKSRQRIVQALTTIEQQLPFPLRGVDSDNGSEFINDHLLAWWQNRPTGQPVQFTRSRPYKKDDNAHVEQKNWTHVRKLVGWERYDTSNARAALNALSADLRLFQNLFQPSMKLVHKVRVGSRLVRRYDRPQTPFERLQAYPVADPQKMAALAQVLKTTDPLALSQRIDRHLEQLWALATRVSRTPRETAPRPPQSRASTPWRGWTFSRRVHNQRRVSASSQGSAGGYLNSDQRAIASYTPTVQADLQAPGAKHRTIRVRRPT
ncbi:MAG: integrase [Nitrospira sp. LK70]|nr:integrase [Nitrospira sp. LK70]